MVSVLFSLALLSQPGEAPTCEGRYGQPVEFASGCKVIRFPDFEIEYESSGRPNPDVALFCRNYSVRDGSEAVSFSHCSTGVLGGSSRFTLSGAKYVVDRDVAAGCVGGRRVLGLTIWRDSADLPPYDVRTRGGPRPGKCDE